MSKHQLIPSGCAATVPLSLVIAWTVPAAEPAPLISNRPGFGIPAATVPGGLIQVEGGVSFARVAASENLTLGEIYALYGVTSDTEVFVGLPSFSSVRGAGTDQSEFQDLTVGSKHRLLRSRGRTARPDIVLAGYLSYPVEGDAPGGLVPTVGPAFGWTLPRNWSVGVTILYSYATDGDERYNQLSGGASAGYAFTDRLGGFAEWYCPFPIRTLCRKPW